MAAEAIPAISKYPFIAEAVDAYSKYIQRWAIGKGFWAPCGMCNGQGVRRDPDFESDPPMILCSRCNGNCVEPVRNFGEQIALVHSELSEALEAFRSKEGLAKKDEHCPEFSAVEIEFADTMIRLMDMSAAYGLRLGAAIEAKMAFNETRPYKHGKKF